NHPRSTTVGDSRWLSDTIHGGASAPQSVWFPWRSGLALKPTAQDAENTGCRMLEDRIAAEIPHLRRYARALTRQREAADDLVQDTLERALRKRHLWRPNGRLRSWLFRMLYNVYLNQQPRQRRERDNVVPLEMVQYHLGQTSS